MIYLLNRLLLIEAIKYSLYAKPVHSVYITGDQSLQFFVRRALAHLSKTLFPVLQRHRRSWCLLSSEKSPSDSESDLGWSLLSKSPPRSSGLSISPQVSVQVSALSFGSSLYPLFPKKNLLNTRGRSTPRLSSLIIGRP
ncbi:uncharacterized protein TNCV_4836181 [Trichonephila clavipes]|nr:uncharacterized protein TNCV_4836181 [Trichonephila clavipes]